MSCMINVSVQDKVNALRAQGKTVIFTKPITRKVPAPCRACGSTRFFFVVDAKDAICEPFCMDCGEPQPAPQKIHRAKFKRSGVKTKSWAIAVRERYNNECALCGRKTNLEVHHIVPFSVDPSIRYEVNNGILLCHECHMLAHKAFCGPNGVKHE